MPGYKTKEAGRGAASLILVPPPATRVGAWGLIRSEPEAKPRGRSKVVEDLVAICQAVRDSRIHEAGVEVELLGDLPIDVKRNRIQLACAAACHRGAVAEATHVKAVLIVVVVGDACIDSGGEGVSRAGPADLQMLTNGESVLRDISENDRYSSDAGKACRERRGWVRKRDVFVAAVHSEL